ncbi:hypothetical protein QFZ75_003656 [Streptomyces sp. V3I8]|uniref:hypothetical protein n=1 Tax=Streptomyces sp. V3I8 TaxID=3042279 RepID=UPI00278598DE|nr:hypothetical protein [Streptomyces sp. V3I8]MDQ1037240.1 hypothetical protein [Streptomyces sp. V3I8]
MTRTACILCWAYLLGSGLTTYCAAASAENHAPEYAAGLGTVTVLLVTAAVREYIAADERRAEAVRAERAARLHGQVATRGMRATLANLHQDACCDLWWPSCGLQHASTCKTQRRSV